MEQFAIINSSQEENADEMDFTYIFETYYKRIYNYIYYRVNNSAESEDLTSQVFEKVMVKIEIYSKQKAPFEVWLFAIARNVINDYFRSLKRNRLFSIDIVNKFVSTEKNPEDMVLQAETNDELLRALKVLNSREKNIVALKFGGNLKNTEIAEILNISESNVGVTLYRIMKKLKAEMEKEARL